MMIFDYLLEHNRYLSIVGIAVIIGIAILFSKKRSAINYRLIATALALQWIIALFTLKFPIGQQIFGAISAGIEKLYLFGERGSAFIFGEQLINPAGPWGFVFAIKLLPIIVFFW